MTSVQSLFLEIEHTLEKGKIKFLFPSVYQCEYIVFLCPIIGVIPFLVAAINGLLMLRRSELFFRRMQSEGNPLSSKNFFTP